MSQLTKSYSNNFPNFGGQKYFSDSGHQQNKTSYFSYPKANISLKGRFDHLKGDGFHNTKIRRAIGGTLLALGAVFAAAAVVAGIAFTATPLVVIGVFTALVVVAVAAKVTGIVFLALPSSWKCPYYRQEKAKAAIADIQKHALSYQQIRSKYGTQIDKYSILTNEDINTFLASEVSKLLYPLFINRHSVAVLDILNSHNKSLLRKNFLSYLLEGLSQTKHGYKYLRKNFRKELEYFKVSKKEINNFLGIDVEKLNYHEFLSKHEKDVLQVLDEKNKATLKEKFIDHLKGFHKGEAIPYANVITTLKTELAIFTIDDSLISEIIGEDIDTCGFQGFIRKHGPCALKILSEIDKAQLKKHFLDFIKGRENGEQAISFKSLVTVHKKMCEYFELTAQEVRDYLFPDIQSMSFKKVIKKHGDQWLLNPWFLSKGEDICTAKQKEVLGKKFRFFVDNLSCGAVNFKKKYTSHCTILGVDVSEVELEMAKKDFANVAAKEMGYGVFRKRNELSAISKLDPESRNILFNAFIDYITDKELGMASVLDLFGEDCKFFKISKEDLENLLLPKDLKRLESGEINYAYYRKKHGPASMAFFSETQKEKILPFFLNHLEETRPGVEKALELYSDDILYLGVQQSEIVSKILEDEVAELKAGKINYSHFVTRNGKDSIEDLTDTQVEVVKDALKKEVIHSGCGFIVGKIKFLEEFNGLGMDEQTLARVILPKELALFVNNALSYQQLKERNGIDSSTYFSEEEKKQYAYHIASILHNTQPGLVNALNTYGGPFSSSMGASDQYITNVVIPGEVNKVQKGELDYPQFLMRNSLYCLEDLIASELEIVKSSFLDQDYTTMMKPVSNVERELLGITAEDIQQVLEKDVINLDYSAYLSKHGRKSIEELGDASLETLRKKLLAKVSQLNSYPELIENYEDEFSKGILINGQSIEVKRLVNKYIKDNLDIFIFEQKDFYKCKMLEYGHIPPELLKALAKTNQAIEDANEQYSQALKKLEMKHIVESDKNETIKAQRLSDLSHKLNLSYHCSHTQKLNAKNIAAQNDYFKRFKNVDRLLGQQSELDKKVDELTRNIPVLKLKYTQAMSGVAEIQSEMDQLKLERQMLELKLYHMKQKKVTGIVEAGKALTKTQQIEKSLKAVVVRINILMERVSIPATISFQIVNKEYELGQAKLKLKEIFQRLPTANKELSAATQVASQNKQQYLEAKKEYDTKKHQYFEGKSSIDKVCDVRAKEIDGSYLNAKEELDMDFHHLVESYKETLRMSLM